MTLVNKKVSLYLYFRKRKSFDMFLKERYSSIASVVKGVYFGEEFCENMLPSWEDVRAVLVETVSRGWMPVLVTGIAAENTLKTYEKLFGHLRSRKIAPGVVFNDWGVLQILRQEYPEFEPIMGRMLFKNKRFIYRMASPNGFRDAAERSRILKEQLVVLRRSNLDSLDYRKLLNAQGVVKVDVDMLPQGLVLDIKGGLDVGAYFPWGYLTSGRTCPLWEGGARFVPAGVCRSHRCVGQKALRKEDHLNTVLLEVGNTVFYKVNGGHGPYIQRLIYEVDIDFKADLSGLALWPLV